MKKVKNTFYFDSVQDATDWLIKVDGKSFDIVCAGDGSYMYLIDAISALQRSLSRARNCDAVISWHNLGPGSAHIELSNIKSIPVVNGSVADRLSKLLDGMKDGDEALLDPVAFPPGYVRTVLSAKGFNAHTKTAPEGLFIVKGLKKRSDAQAIREVVEAIKGSSAEIELAFDPAYVRTIISKLANSEYRYSVKHFPARGSFLVSKVYYDAQKNNDGVTAEFSREYVETILSPLETMAFFAMLERLKAGKPYEADPRTVEAAVRPIVPAVAAVGPEPQPLDVDDFLPDVKPAKGKAVDYDTRDLEDVTADDDPDNYDPKALRMPDVKAIFGEDDEDLGF